MCNFITISEREAFDSILQNLRNRIIRRVYYEMVLWKQTDLLKTDSINYHTHVDNIHTVDFCVHLVTDSLVFQIGWGTFDDWTWSIKLGINDTVHAGATKSGHILEMTADKMWQHLVGQTITEASAIWASVGGVSDAYPHSLKISTDSSECFLSAAEFIDKTTSVVGSMSNILVTTSPEVAKSVMRFT